jgi:dTDP-4-amino-4,6-dideoxygalactose transaminase
LHLQNALPSKFRNISQNLDVSVNLGENGLYLPMGNHINKNLQKRIINIFRKVIS